MFIALYNGSGLGHTKINYDGDIFFSTSVKIANKSCYKSGCATGETVSGKSWIKGTITFDNVPRFDTAEILQISFYFNGGNLYPQDLILRDIPIE